LRDLVDKKRFEQAEALASANQKLIQSSEARTQTRREMQKAFLESLYWQRKDDEVLSHMRTFFDADAIDKDPELSLFRAVTSFRTDRAGWQSHFERLFSEHTASSIHIRAYRYLTQEPDRISRFSERSRALLEGKHELAIGHYAVAVGLLERAVSGLSAASLSGTTLVKELGFAHLHARSYVRGAAYLDALAPKLGFKERLDAIEMSGRNYRQAFQRAKAEANLRKVTSETQNALQRDRCLWFILDMRLKSSRESGLAEIERSAAQWSNAGYFDDVLDKLLTELTLKKDDTSLLRLYRVARPYVSSFILFRLEFTLAVRGYEVAGPNGGAPIKTSGSLSRAMGTLYYTFLLSVMGRGNSTIFGVRRKTSDAHEKKDGGKRATQDGGAKTDSRQRNSVNGLVLGFMDFGLYERGYGSALRNLEALDAETLFGLASRMAAANHLADGMRLMDIYLARRPGSPTLEEWRLAYPRPYRNQLESLAGDTGIPLPLLYAVIREESYFDPHSGSRAGAVGLMQLMPETAEEMAGELKLQGYNLKNPEDNLELGTRYLAKLLRKTGSWPKTLMSYNAGPTKVRRWTRRYRSFADELIVEIVPFAETRHYVRKVLVSTVLYSLIYTEDLDAKDVAASFYPYLLNRSAEQSTDD
jgi:hypothetical protein